MTRLKWVVVGDNHGTFAVMPFLIDMAIGPFANREEAQAALAIVEKKQRKQELAMHPAKETMQ